MEGSGREGKERKMEWISWCDMIVTDKLTLLIFGVIFG